MTPRELFLAADHRRQNERVQITTAAWMSAYYQRVKKLPDLKHEILGILKPKKLAKSASDHAREQLEAIKKMTENG